MRTEQRNKQKMACSSSMAKLLNVLMVVCMAAAVCTAAPTAAGGARAQLRRSHGANKRLRMRVNSLLDSVADAVEHVSNKVKKTVLHPRLKHDYKLLVRNASVIVATARGSLAPSRLLWRSGIEHGHVIMWVDEAQRNSTVRTVQHWFKLGSNEDAEQERIAVHAVEGGGATARYEMVIPLLPQRAGRRGAQWGTAREEDSYEFLQAQMECARGGARRQSTTARMLCACEMVHSSDAEHALRCATRVAQRAARTARSAGRVHVALRLLVRQTRCRRAADAAARTRCVVAAVRDADGEGERGETEGGIR